jgi:hypothetical protein
MNKNLYKRYASILNFLPIVRLHDIIVVPVNNSILTIDYTPINQSQPSVLLKLFVGKYLPAEVRIRRMRVWNLTEWYNSPCIILDDISDNLMRNKITKVIDNWNCIDNSNTKKIGMNLYKRNCKHFSNFFIKNF